MRGDAALLLRAQVHDPQVALGRGDVLDERELPAVVGEAEAVPAAAVEGRDDAIGLGLERFDDMHDRRRLALRVVAVDGLRRVHEPIALARERPPRRALTLGAQRRRRASRGVVADEPEHFVAALAAREDEILALRRFPRRVVHGVGEVGERRGRRARLGNEVELIGRVEPPAHEHLAAQRMPRDETVRAELAVRLQLLLELERDRRHAFEHEVGGRSDEFAVGGRGHRREQRRGEHGGVAEAHRLVVGLGQGNVATGRLLSAHHSLHEPG